MIPKIFNIERGKIVINENCLLIPELKEVVNKYKDPIPALSFLHYYFDVEGPYFNLIEKDKEKSLIKEFKGTYKLDDKVIIDALIKLKELNITTLYQYYLDNKCLVEKIGQWSRDVEVTDDNIAKASNQIKFVSKTISEFKELEKTVLEEINQKQGKYKANKKAAYDQL